MKQTMRRLLSLILTLLLLVPGLSAGEAAEMEEVEDFAPESAAVVEKDGYHFDARGFLVGENPGREYMLEDEKNGIWQYASKDLAIRVTRYREKIKKSKKIDEYCVAEIWCSESSPLGAFMTDRGFYKKDPAPGLQQQKPSVLMQQHPSVFCVSDDMYGLRKTPVSGGKTKYDYHGVIIRYGEVLATKTRKSPEEGKKDKRPWPNMDTLAVYQDGSMKTFVSGDRTAEEYLADGAVHVFAFGPWLISGGEVNPALYDANYYPSNEPRIAIGMIEPYHYIIIGHAGRPKEKYAGTKLLWLAEKMKEYGCTEALNLDGGATVVMAFNNKIILQGDYSGERNIGSMIAFGIK